MVTMRPYTYVFKAGTINERIFLSSFTLIGNRVDGDEGDMPEFSCGAQK